MNFDSAAANGLATRAFQKCNWGQIDLMVDRGLKCKKNFRTNLNIFKDPISRLINPIRLVYKPPCKVFENM